MHMYEKSNCALVFPVYLFLGGKWWTGGGQNKLTCAGILEASGAERCFYEGVEVYDLMFNNLNLPSSWWAVSDIFPWLNGMCVPAVVCCRS